MRMVLILLAGLFLVGLILGGIAAVLGTTWAILLGTIAAIWFVRAAVTGRLDPDKFNSILGGKTDKKDPPEGRRL